MSATSAERTALRTAGSGKAESSLAVSLEPWQELKRLASELGATVGETVALAVRRLRQDRIGDELVASLTPDEVVWLDADLG